MFTYNGQRFETAEIARAVHEGATPGRCNWLVERIVWLGDDEYGYERDVRTEDCGAEAAFTDDRFWCVDGHEHVSTEARQHEGWDYAEDEYDAAVIARGGRAYRPMGPNTTIDERKAAEIMSQL